MFTGVKLKVAVKQLNAAASTSGVISRHTVSVGKHVRKCAPRKSKEIANKLSMMLLKVVSLNTFDQTRLQTSLYLCLCLIL
jgi:hypothetical protein